VDVGVDVGEAEAHQASGKVGARLVDAALQAVLAVDSPAAIEAEEQGEGSLEAQVAEAGMVAWVAAVEVQAKPMAEAEMVVDDQVEVATDSVAEAADSVADE
jgi:hypothetical protein